MGAAYQQAADPCREAWAVNTPRALLPRGGCTSWPPAPTLRAGGKIDSHKLRSLRAQEHQRVLGRQEERTDLGCFIYTPRDCTNLCTLRMN